MSKADETIKEAVKESIGVLTEHIQPGDLDSQGQAIEARDCEATINKVTTLLDNPVVQEAIEESDSASEDAKRAATSQREHPEDYPSPKRRSAAS
jgi:hypothetical protein